MPRPGERHGAEDDRALVLHGTAIGLAVWVARPPVAPVKLLGKIRSDVLNGRRLFTLTVK